MKGATLGIDAIFSLTFAILGTIVVTTILPAQVNTLQKFSGAVDIEREANIASNIILSDPNLIVTGNTNRLVVFNSTKLDANMVEKSTQGINLLSCSAENTSLCNREIDSRFFILILISDIENGKGWLSSANTSKTIRSQMSCAKYTSIDSIFQSKTLGKSLNLDVCKFLYSTRLDKGFDSIILYPNGDKHFAKLKVLVVYTGGAS